MSNTEPLSQVSVDAESAIEPTLANLRARGFVYLLLASDRRAIPLPPGQLAAALQFIRHQDTQAQLFELCSPTVGLHFSAWAAKRARKAN